ncbi:MAG TPA: hypothetical protein VF939_12040 [Puia sp.]
MSTGDPEIHEQAIELAGENISLHTGFRLATTNPLAGGPIEIEFFIDNNGSSSFPLALVGDRSRQRPGKFSFTASLEGVTLEDPMAMMDHTGGPATVVEVLPGSSWRQLLVLGEFIRLEDSLAVLGQNTTGRMKLVCRRPLILASTKAAALSGKEVRTVAADLVFDLLRNDQALTTLAAELMKAVMDGPQDQRERPLSLLLAMRTAAHNQIEGLTHHPDRFVIMRAKYAISTFRNEG